MMEKNDKHPATLDEAVDILMEELSFGDRTIIANIREDDLRNLDFVFRNRIMFEFGLWNENNDLLQSCRHKSDHSSLDPDMASVFIIKRLWKTVHNTRVLEVVK